MKLSGVSVFFFLDYEKKKKKERLPVRTDLTVTFFTYSDKKKQNKYTPRKVSLSYSLTRKVRSIDRSFLT